MDGFARRINADLQTLDLVRMARMSIEDLQKERAEKLKKVADDAKLIDDEFGPRKKALLNPIRIYLIAGMLLFLIGNPLETKKRWE